MRPDIFTVIVLCIAIVCYAIDKIPLVITAMLAMLTMYFTGILDFSTAFSGFSNNVVMMLIGTQILGTALSRNGLVDIVSNGLNKLFSRDRFGEKQFILIAGLLIAVISTVINPTLMVLMFCEIIDGLSTRENSKITRRNTYLPMAVASTCGCMFTSISSTTICL